MIPTTVKTIEELLAIIPVQYKPELWDLKRDLYLMHMGTPDRAWEAGYEETLLTAGGDTPFDALAALWVRLEELNR